VAERPFDCGFAFVRERIYWDARLRRARPYLPEASDDRPTSLSVPELSRRARSLAVWATLAAYGRSGYPSDRGALPRQRRATRCASRGSDDFELLGRYR